MTGSRDSLQNAAAATTAAEAMIMMPVGGDVMRVIASWRPTTWLFKGHAAVWGYDSVMPQATGPLQDF